MAGYREWFGVEPPDDEQTPGAWMFSRAAQRTLRQYAEAAGREAWEQATRDGDPVTGAGTDDLVALGMRSLADGPPADDPPSAASDEDFAPEPIRPVEPDGPLVRPADVRFATARPGDSISRLVGSSDPAAIGRFLALNGLRAGDSTIFAGRNYAVPTSEEDASPEETAAGRRLLRRDNDRLAALRAQQAAAEAERVRQAQWFRDGRNIWTGQQVGEAPRVRAPAPPSKPLPPRHNWLDDNAVLKGALGDPAQELGIAYGVIRGGVHSVEGLIDGARFLGSLPFDPSARQEAVAMARTGANYVRTRAQDPSLIARDAGNWINSENIRLNPDATPMEPTFSGELRRRFGVGANEGEAAFNAGSVLYGGEVAKGLEALAVARELPAVERYVRASLPPEEAAYMLEPYDGMGAHYVPRRTRLPQILGGGPLPKGMMNSRYNVSKLQGATRWQQYRHHFMNDPKYSGGKVRGRAGKGSGWSGQRYGWERNDPITRLIAGMPADTRGLLGGAAVSGLDQGYDALDQDRPQ